MSEDGTWKEVTRKNRHPKAKKTTVGTSAANLEEFTNHLVRPDEFWVGNISLRTDKEIVVKVLKKCAESLGVSDFVVLKVELLNKPYLNKDDKPRNKSWRVQIPHKFKEIMMKDEMYPSGWSHRTFWYGRRGQDKNKKESNMVSAAIRERDEEKTKDSEETINTEKLLAEVVDSLPAGFNPELKARLAVARERAEGVKGAQSLSINVQ